MRHPPLNRGLVTAPRTVARHAVSAVDQPPALGVTDFYGSGRFAVEAIMAAVEDYEKTI